MVHKSNETVLLYFGALCLLSSLFFLTIYIGEQDEGFTGKIACATSMYVVGLLILVQPVLQKLNYLGPGDYVSARYHPALNAVGVIVAGWGCVVTQGGYNTFSMLATMSGVLSVFFFIVFVRPISVDYGLLHMLCGLGYRFSYDETRISTFVVCSIIYTLVLVVRLILDIFARDAIAAAADSASGPAV